MKVVSYILLGILLFVGVLQVLPPTKALMNMGTRNYGVPIGCPNQLDMTVDTPGIFVFRGRYLSEIPPRELTKVEQLFYKYFTGAPTSHYIFSVDHKYNNEYLEDKILLGGPAWGNTTGEAIIFVKMEKTHVLSDWHDFDVRGTCASFIGLDRSDRAMEYSANRIMELEHSAAKTSQDAEEQALNGLDYYRERFAGTYMKWYELTRAKARLFERYGRYDEAQKTYEEALVYVANTWRKLSGEMDGLEEYSRDAPLNKRSLGKTCEGLNIEVDAPAFFDALPNPKQIQSLKQSKAEIHKPWELFYSAQRTILDYGRLLYRNGLYERALLPLCLLPDHVAYRKHHKAREWRILALLKLGLKDKIPMDVFDMSGIKINKLDLSDIALRNTNFSGADIGELIVKNTKIPSSSFQEARIGNLIVYETDLSQSNFNHAVVTNGWMKKSDISGTSFVCANLTLSDLSESKTGDAIWDKTYRSVERQINNSSTLDNDTTDYQTVCADLLREQKRQERIEKK